MRNTTVTRLLGGGRDRNEQRFVAVTTLGNYQKGQIYRVLFSGANAALTQYGKELKALDGRITFLLPSQQIVFNQDGVEQALHRLQNNWLMQLRAKLLGVNLQLSYDDHDDFEVIHSDKQKPVYVPKQLAYEAV
jgi:hypothetical protein